MKRNITVLAAVGLMLAVTTGAVAAQKYVITSSSQIKPGAISSANLSATAKRQLAGKRGPAGQRGPAGVPGPQGLPGANGAPGATGAQGSAGAAGATGPQGPKGDTGAPGATGADGSTALAKASGLVAWTADPGLIVFEGNDTSGAVHGTSVLLTTGQVVTSLSELVVSPGAAMTHGMYAIYDKDLHLVASTADTPAAFLVTNQWAELPLTSPYTVPATGLYYFVDLLAATSTTPVIGMAGFDTATDGRSILPGGVRRNVHQGGLSAFPATLVSDATGATRSIVAR